jgi:predicted transcriptional regulator
LNTGVVVQHYPISKDCRRTIPTVPYADGLEFSISLTLQVIRERSGYTSRELARSAGLSPEVMCRIEAGAIGPDYLTVARLTQVLRVSLAEIATAAHALDPAMVKDYYDQMVAR